MPVPTRDPPMESRARDSTGHRIATPTSPADHVIASAHCSRAFLSFLLRYFVGCEQTTSERLATLQNPPFLSAWIDALRHSAARSCKPCMRAFSKVKMSPEAAANNKSRQTFTRVGQRGRIHSGWCSASS